MGGNASRPDRQCNPCLTNITWQHYLAVHGLWTLLEPFARPVLLESLCGKRLAIDASIWLYQFLKAMRDREGRELPNAHIVGFLRRICKLLFYGIKPVFVFDGAVPVLKRRTMERRRARKAESERNYQRTAARLLELRLQKALRTGTLPRRAPAPAADGPEERADERLDRVTGKARAAPPTQTPTGAAQSTTPSAVTRVDPRLPTRDELQSFVAEYVAEHAGEDGLVDVTSQAFQQLPVEAQYEIVAEAKNQSRESSFVREETFLTHSAAAESALDFSQAQIRGLVQRNDWTQRLMALAAGTSAASATGPGQRVAGARNRRYILVKDETDAGWEFRPAVSADLADSPSAPSAEPDESREPPAITAAVEPVTAPSAHTLLQGLTEQLSAVVAKSRSLVNAGEFPIVQVPSRGMPEIAAPDEELAPDEQALYRDLVARAPPAVRAKVPDVDQRLRQWLSRQTTPLSELHSALLAAVESVSDSGTVLRQAHEFIRECLEAIIALREGLGGLEGFRGGPSGFASVGRMASGSSSSRDVSRPRVPAGAAEMDEDDLMALLATQTGASEPLPPAATDDDDEFEEVAIPAASRDVSAAATHDDLGSGMVEPEILFKESTPDDARLDLSLEDSGSEGSLVDVSDVAASAAHKGAEVAPVSLIPDDSSASSQPQEQSPEARPIEQLVLQEDFAEEHTSDNGPTKEPSAEEPQTDDPSTNAQPAEENEVGTAAERQWEEEREAAELAAEESSPWLPRNVLDREITSLAVQQRREMRDAAQVTAQMTEEAQELLRCFGLPFVIAPTEAESQCAFLLEAGLVDGIATDDSDVFLFGGALVYRNMFNPTRHVEHYRLDDLERELGLRRGDLVLLAYLLGSDYTEGIRGIGLVTAVEVLQEWRASEESGPPLGILEAFGDFLRQQQDPVALAAAGDATDATERRRRAKFGRLARRVDLAAAWPEPAVWAAYMAPEVDSSRERFRWGAPQHSRIAAFAQSKLGWDPSETDRLILPVLREMESRAVSGVQTDIGGFFGPGVKRGRFSSQRLQRAVSRIRGNSGSSADAGADEAGTGSRARGGRKRRAGGAALGAAAPETPETEAAEETPETEQRSPRRAVTAKRPRKKGPA